MKFYDAYPLQTLINNINSIIIFSRHLPNSINLYESNFKGYRLKIHFKAPIAALESLNSIASAKFKQI